MNPNVSNGSEMHLPAPVAEPNSGPEMVSKNGNSAPGRAPESQASRPEQAPTGTATTMPAMPTVAIRVSSPADPGAATNGVISTTNSVVSLLADDSDLIEKEWVNKAKQIIERTSEDPHQESQQLTDLKADYMKKRYNKTIKPSE